MQKITFILTIVLTTFYCNYINAQCAANLTESCSPSVTGVGFTAMNVNPSSCLANNQNQAAYIVWNVENGGGIDATVTGNVAGGFFDVAIFTVPPGTAPCDVTNADQITCSFAPAAGGCTSWGANPTGCSSNFPAIPVNDCDRIIVIVENYSSGSTSFDVQINNTDANGGHVSAPEVDIPDAASCTSAGAFQMPDDFDSVGPLAFDGGVDLPANIPPETGADIDICPNAAGGTWSASCGACITTTGVFNPAVSGAGTHTVDYTLTSAIDPSCDATNSAVVLVDADPDPQFTCPAADVCASDGMINLGYSDNNAALATNGAPTLVVTGSGAAFVNTTTHMFDAAAAGAGTYTITYALTSVNALCEDFATCNIVVVSCCPTVTVATSNQQICSGDAADLSDATTGFAILTDPQLAGDLVWTNDGAAPLPDLSNVTDGTALTHSGSSCSSENITLNAWLECDAAEDGFANPPAADDSYVTSGSVDVEIYPVQPVGVVNTILNNSCSGAANVVVIDLMSADNSTVCDSKSINGDVNNTCQTAAQTALIEWTVAEIETALGTPVSTTCYNAVSTTNNVSIYPEQPTAAVVNVGADCTGATAVVIYDIVSVDGTVCDTRSLDSTPNLSCDIENQNITDTYSAADLETLFTADAACYVDVDVDESVAIHPDANNWAVAEIIGACDIPATVAITAEDGSECFAQTGVTPVDPGCDNPDDVQDLTYTFDPGLLAACNATFGNTVAASCATTFFSADAAFTCPLSADLCSTAGIVDLFPLDNNNIAGATGFFTGNAAGYVAGDTNPNGNATIDLTQVPINIPLTLEYNVQVAGCPASTTVTNCSFSVIVTCGAEGGAFGN